MEIEREWGQVPGWFSSQPSGVQARLIAWRRVRIDPDGQHFKASKAPAAGFWKDTT